MSNTIKQRYIADCGATCLAFAADYYGLKIPIAHIRQFAHANKKGDSITEIIATAKQIGFAVKGVRGDIDALPKVSLPAIAHIVTPEKKHCCVTIISLEKGSIVYMDPVDGKSHRLSLNDFDKLWTGVLILLMPSKSSRGELLRFQFTNTMFF